MLKYHNDIYSDLCHANKNFGPLVTNQQVPWWIAHINFEAVLRHSFIVGGTDNVVAGVLLLDGVDVQDTAVGVDAVIPVVTA